MSRTIKYRFAALPIDLLNDGRLDALDKIAFAVLLDASREGFCEISELRLGERIQRSEATARRVLRRLEATGWIVTVKQVNGVCRVYRLLTPSTDVRGTPSTDAAYPLQKRLGTPSTDGAHSKLESKLIPKAGNEQNHDGDSTSQVFATNAVVTPSGRCVKNVNEDEIFSPAQRRSDADDLPPEVRAANLRRLRDMAAGGLKRTPRDGEPFASREGLPRMVAFAQDAKTGETQHVKDTP